MTSLSSFHSLNSISFIYKPSAAAHPHNIPAVRSSLPSLHSQANGCWSCRRPAAQKSTVQRINSVAEDTQIPESSGAEEEEVFSDQSFSVPVSPSDKLIMYFLADGVIDEKDIPTVSKALEGTEGISDLKFGVSEGIASIQLVKQTTIQATGVASDLVAIIQGSGFKTEDTKVPPPAPLAMPILPPEVPAPPVDPSAPPAKPSSPPPTAAAPPVTDVPTPPPPAKPSAPPTKPYPPPTKPPTPALAPPQKAPVPPTPYRPPVKKEECAPLCEQRCILQSRKKLCVRACSTCCARCKCVPPGTYGNRELCGKCYTDMTTHGNRIKCP